MRMIALAAGTLISALLGSPLLAFDGSEDHFEAKVRPVLVEKCLSCHGASKQSSGLRLDSREALLKGGDTEGAAIVPGDPDASPLVKAIRHADDLKMPPKEQLPDAVVRDLADWVKAGAAWPKDVTIVGKDEKASTHWSFRPVKKPEVPSPNGVRPRSPIDLLLESRIASQGLSPAGRADRRTLIRRATFDLIGLPPTPQEVEAFVEDDDPDEEAFAEVVDRLLASPHYGERWGRHWLDVARYADTKGYVFDQDRKYPYAYTYRDWVVAALNDDMPYDKFVLNQLAADRMPPGPDNDDLAALGFLTVGRRFLQDKNEIIDDRIDVVTRGLLGMSVSCARCHDHKFDPIPTEDYYSLYGVFDSSEEPAELPILRDSGREKDSIDYQKKLADRKKAVETFLSDKRTELQAELSGRIGDYLAAADVLAFNPRSLKLDEQARSAKLRPELLRRLITSWKNRLEADDAFLAPWKAFADLPADGFRDRAAGLAAAIKQGIGPRPAPPEDLADAIAENPPESRSDLPRRYGDLIAKALASPADPDYDDIRRWLEAPKSPIAIAAEDAKKLLNKAERNRLRDLERKLSELDSAHPGAPARAMVMVDQAKPHDANIFIRGNAGRPGKTVPRRFLKALSPPDRPSFGDQGSGRLELAQAIVKPDNPLTSRVMVNRIWLNHFGQGLVRTPSDFGLRGDAPTHPELLDWLAATFVEGDWSIKAMHRKIMLTDAYARSSKPSEEDLKRDPANFLFAHQNRRRLDFEAMRDALLSASGRLDPSLGGKSVPLESEPYPTRRTLYGYIDRYNIDPLFRTFDFPNPDASSPRRLATTVPQQALYLLNSPFVADQARRFASRPDIGSVPVDVRVGQLHRILFGRGATPQEIDLARRFLALQSEPGHEPPPPAWQYGVGHVDDSAAGVRVTSYRPLCHWTGKGYQAGPMLPNPEFNYANWTATGGHPGPNPDKALVLRWVSPGDFAVAISGSLAHPNKEGDGVRLRLISDRTGQRGDWVAFNSNKETDAGVIEVKKGEILDFVVDCLGGEAFDSFTFSALIRVSGPPPADLPRASWDSRADFRGPLPSGLNAWEAYAQALLMSNEFLFID